MESIVPQEGNASPFSSHLLSVSPSATPAVSPDTMSSLFPNVAAEAKIPPSSLINEIKRTFYVSPLETYEKSLQLPLKDQEALSEGIHADPFSILGPHYLPSDGTRFTQRLMIRCWIKDAKTIDLHLLPSTSSSFHLTGCLSASMRCVKEWLFEMVFNITLSSPEETKDITSLFPKLFYELSVTYMRDPTQSLYKAYDPYQFGLLLSNFDLKLFQSGSCWHVDNLLGSKIVCIEGIDGIRFSVWAPTCQCVSVVGDWNGWERSAHPMRKRMEFGVWEIFIPGSLIGQKYGYSIVSTTHPKGFVKIDPYAQEFENPPATASIISGCDDAFKAPEDRFQWTDQEWISRRIEAYKTDAHRRSPMSIYEVHLPSWIRGDNNSYL
ncbi:1,4-alpha-glucan-branching enzyme, partial [Cardiosporidium cionae]